MSRFTSRCMTDKPADLGVSSLTKNRVARPIRLDPFSKHRGFLTRINITSETYDR
jgi:hypothetical protein